MSKPLTSPERWVSFPDAAEVTDGLITVGYAGLPSGLDPDKLQVNVTALERGVIGWGGYAALTLAAYKGNGDSYSVGVGTDSSGNAYGVGTASVSKAESSEINPASDSRLNGLDIRNGTLGIQWNIGALNSRIETHQQYDPAIRAKQINREVRRGAIRGVVSHNLGDVISDKPWFMTAIMGGFDCLFVSQVASEALQKDFSAAAFRVATRAVAMQTLIRSLRTVYNHESSFGDQIIDPLFWTVRPMRTMAGVGTLATSRLVRPTPAGM